MKILHVFFGVVCFGLSFQLEAQNIILNEGFEEIFACPSSANDVSFASPWESSGGSPDLFNVCGSLGYEVPLNKVGFQEAKSGEGYALFATYSDISDDAREFLQGELKYPLIANEQYYFQTYVSQCDSLQFATHNIGITFTEDDPSTHLTCYPNCEVYYENEISNPLTSKTDWMLIEGNFVANGGEQFIHIGNLRTDSLSEIEFVGGGVDPDVAWEASGYYIDDVWLSHMDSMHYVSVNEELGVNNYKLEVFPNPASDFVSIDFSIQPSAGRSLEVTVEMFDAVGRLVKSEPWKSEIDVSALPDGVYLLKVVFENGAFGTKRLVVQR